MLIQIEKRRTGKAILKDIKSQWRNRKAILEDDSPEAREALFWWGLLHEDNKRLEEVHRQGTTIELEAEDLRFLSAGRLALLRHAARHEGESLGHVAEHLGRDLANVKRDTDKLCELGLLRAEKKGRELRISPAGNTIQIDLLG